MRVALRLAAFLACSAGLAPAQTSPLTLEDCVRLALKAPSAVTIALEERRISEYGVSAARASLLPQFQIAIIQRDLKRAVTTAFYQLVLVRRLVASNRNVLKEAESFAERTRIIYREGEVAQADVTKADSPIAFLEQAVQAAELDAQTANAALASFWTADVSPELNVADNLESQPASETTQSDRKS